MTVVSGDDFDWDESSSVVVHEKAGVAVYLNDAFGGAVVIRERGDGYDPDHYIRLAIKDASKVARAIMEAAAHASEFPLERPAPAYAKEFPAAKPAPKDRTAADRQRRHRAKKKRDDRNADRVSVTDEANGHPSASRLQLDGGE